MVRIFIADDRELVRSALREVIQQTDQNWEVCGEAANGREAIDKAVELAPDVIILDIAMPVLDGIGAAKEIRARLPDVPILMYTFMSFGHLEVLAKEAGAWAVVQKGDSRALIREIRKVLRETAAADGQAAPDGDGAQMISNSVTSTGGTGTPAEMGALHEGTEAKATDDTLPDGAMEPSS